MGKKDAGIVRLPCDDLATQEGGWVEMCAYLQVRHLPYVEATDKRNFEKGWEELSHSQKGNKVLALRYELLAAFVTDWNWKDPEGKPYPKPAGNTEVFGMLKPLEHHWLWEKVWEIIGEGYGIPKASGTLS